MPRNRYLMDRAMRRSSMRGDGRNPYGSRGGYVSSRRMRDRAMNDMARGSRGGNRGYDRAMDDRNYYPEHDSRHYDRNMSDYRGQDSHRGYEQYGESYRPMDYEMYGYGIGGIRPMYPMDYGYDYASEDMEKEWKEDLEEWCKKLKKHDRFGMPKEQLLQSARQMGVSFDEYDEKEFMTVYYMQMSDYPKIANEPHTYLSMAKDWLHDEDSELKGSEKLCAYYYEIIKGGKED